MRSQTPIAVYLNIKYFTGFFFRLKKSLRKEPLSYLTGITQAKVCDSQRLSTQTDHNRNGIYCNSSPTTSSDLRRNTRYKEKRSAFTHAQTLKIKQIGYTAAEWCTQVICSSTSRVWCCHSAISKSKRFTQKPIFVFMTARKWPEIIWNIFL